VTDKLCQYFPKIMDVAFTRYMEQQLDKIEEQKFDWIKVLKEFYGPFKDNLDKASEEMKHAKAETKPSEYNCPNAVRNWFTGSAGMEDFELLRISGMQVRLSMR